MKKWILLIVFCLTLLSCSKTIMYSPNTQNVDNPKHIIESILRQQPPAYAWVPYDVDVTDEYVKVIYEYNYRATNNFTTMYYINLGKPTLLKPYNKPVWYVNFNDTFGNDLFTAITVEEREAKLLIDALWIMINK